MWSLAKFSHYEELNVNVKHQNKSTIKDVTIYDNKNVTKKWISQLKEKLKPTATSMKNIFVSQKNNKTKQKHKMFC